MDAKETSEIVGSSNDTDIKQELLESEPPDSSTETMDEPITNVGEENLQMMGVTAASEIRLLNAVEDNNPLLLNSVIKQEPKPPPDLELIKSQALFWRVILQRLPTYTHTDTKQEPMDVDQTNPDDVTTPLIPEGSEQLEMEDIKYVNTQDYLDIGEAVICEQDIAISEQDRARPGTSSNHVKQEPLDVDQIDPDDVTTQLIAEGSEQHEMEDVFESEEHLTELKQEDDELGVEEDPNSPEIKYSNTQDYLDIGDTVISEHSLASPSISTENKSGTEKRKDKPREKPYKCEICDSLLKCISKLKRHMRTHTGEKPHKCEVCDYQCTQSGSLKRHMRKHTGEKPYKCETCDHRFALKMNLQVHMRTHTGEKPYKCGTCDYRLARKIQLLVHMRTHTGEKPYKCEVCDYRCTKSGSLKRHMRKHTGEKPYKCETCDYRCTESGSLKRHIRKHTGEKPYKCKTCDYRFAQKSNLQVHMRKHTGEKPYKCEACDCRFAQKIQLLVHTRTHTGEKSYTRAPKTTGVSCPVVFI